MYSEIQRDLFQPILVSSLMANDTFVKSWITQGEENPGEIINYLAQIQERYDTITSFLVCNATGIYYQTGGILFSWSRRLPTGRMAFFGRASNLAIGFITAVIGSSLFSVGRTMREE